MFSLDISDQAKVYEIYEDPHKLLHVVSVNLLTLAKVQADDYMITNGDLFHIQRPSEYRLIPIGFFRFYYGFSRTKTLENIKQLYESSKYLLTKVNLSDEERKKLRELILKSHKGLKKLQVTYIKDVAVYSELQTICDETKRGVFVTDIMPTTSAFQTEETDTNYFE